MSATPSFDSEIAKSRSEIKRDADEMFEKSFAGLDDGTIYRDPMGWKTSGGAGENTVEIQKERWKQFKNEPIAELDGKSVIDFWDSKLKKGFSHKKAADMIQKNLDTGDWTLPLDILPEVFTVNPERLPMADMMTRVATQDDEVTPTPLTDHPEFEFGLESLDDTESSYTYKDASYDEDLSFPILGMGAATRLEDKLILSSSNLRNAESTAQEAFMRGAQQTLERQIIQGTDYNPAGFDGFNDLISGGEGDAIVDIGDPDSTDAATVESAIRTIIDESTYQGTNRDSMGVVTDFWTHQKLRESLVSNVRYDPMDEIFGVSSTLELDGVPIFKSHGIPKADTRDDGSTYNTAYTVNMDATYLSVLQELQMKPLAKTSPQEKMAFDFYGTLTSEENGAHIQAATISPTA